MKNLLVSLLVSWSLILTGYAPAGLAPLVGTAQAAQATFDDQVPDEELEAVEFSGLDDPDLLQYIQDNVYAELVDQFGSEDFLVEDIQTAYLSQEYLEEVAYNSKSNIFFGYTLEELREQFDGTPYVLTLGDDGTTVAVPFEDYDDTYDQIIKNVAVGTGVILVCVTVSVATSATGFYPVSAIFAVAAKGAVEGAFWGGAIDGAISGVVTGVQGGDLGEGLKAAALGASEGFKFGAIVGALTGGATETVALSRFVGNGLTVAEAAKIQLESKWPLAFIESLHSVDEYAVYKAAGLTCQKVGGKWALTRKIDWNKTDELGRTNAMRVKEGLAPIDETGRSYELHHIGQRADSPLAILTKSEHMSDGHNKILHYKSGESQINREVFETEKDEFWLALLDMSVK